MYTLITTKKQLKEIDCNPYNSSGYIFDDLGNIYSVNEFLAFENTHVYNEYNGEKFFYTIHWEGEPIHTESGEVIQPAY